MSVYSECIKKYICFRRPAKRRATTWFPQQRQSERSSRHECMMIDSDRHSGERRMRLKSEVIR